MPDIKDIKTKSGKKPKVRSASARMPKELARTAALEAKEKSGRLTRVAGGMEDSMEKSTEESPGEYASGKVSSAERWTGDHAVRAAYTGGKKLAVKTREKGREKRRESVAAGEGFPETLSGRKAEIRENGRKNAVRKAEQERAASQATPETTEGKIRTKKIQRAGGKESAKRTVKTSPRSVKISPSSRTETQAQQAMKQKKRAEKAAKAAKQAAVQSAKTAKNTQKAAKATIKGTVTVVKAGAAAVKSMIAALGAVGIAIVLVLIIAVGIIGGALSASDSSSSPQPLSKEVLSYTSVIRKYAGQFSEEQAKAHGWSSYGDPEYVPHVLRYYSAGNPFDGLFGNSQIVTVAKAEIGNEGGKKFWSWYGFHSRVSWCAGVPVLRAGVGSNVA